VCVCERERERESGPAALPWGKECLIPVF